MYKIAVLPGDGTGPEVVNEGLKVLEAVSKKYNFEYETTTFDWGGDRYLKTGEVLPEDAAETIEHFKSMGFVDILPDAPRSANPPTWTEFTVHGKSVMQDGKVQLSQEPGARIPLGAKWCRIGKIMFELIQPGDLIFTDPNKEFLDRVGNGISHVAYSIDAEYFDGEVEKLKARGMIVVLSGKMSHGGGFVYFDTGKVGGTMIELMRKVK